MYNKRQFGQPLKRNWKFIQGFTGSLEEDWGNNFMFELTKQK